MTGKRDLEGTAEVTNDDDAGLVSLLKYAELVRLDGRSSAADGGASNTLFESVDFAKGGGEHILVVNDFLGIAAASV